MPLEKMRTLDDFLVGSARYEMPNFRDLEKWNNRILQNLIYYQTNYFAAGAIIACIIGALAAAKTAILIVGAAVVLAAFYVLYVMPNGGNGGASAIAASTPTGIEEADRLLRLAATAVPAHLRTYVFSVIVTGALLALWATGAVLHAMLLVLVPAFAALVHASLRMRNVSNKLVNLLTDARHTPMGWTITRLERMVGGPTTVGAGSKAK